MKFVWYTVLFFVGIGVISAISLEFPLLPSVSMIILGNMLWVTLWTGLVLYDDDLRRSESI